MKYTELREGLQDYKSKETDRVRLDAKELQLKIGKARINAMVKHPWFKDQIAHFTDRAYLHRINHLGDHEVEVYPYFASLHTTDAGKIRPDKFLRFQFYKTKVTNVHLFRREATPDAVWHWVKSELED